MHMKPLLPIFVFINLQQTDIKIAVVYSHIYTVFWVISIIKSV